MESLMSIILYPLFFIQYPISYILYFLTKFITCFISKSLSHIAFFLFLITFNILYIQFANPICYSSLFFIPYLLSPFYYLLFSKSSYILCSSNSLLYLDFAIANFQVTNMRSLFSSINESCHSS
jgi:hypothetical protein